MPVMRMKLVRGAAVRTMSHQEYLGVIRSAVECAGLPVSCGRGGAAAFRITAGPPLGVGHTSRSEYLDFELSAPMSAVAFARRLAAALPAGLDVVWQKRLPAGAPHLMASVLRMSYRVHGAFDPARAEAFQKADAWPMTRIRTKKQQHFDLKQSVVQLAVEPAAVTLTIQVRKEGTPKPGDVLTAVFGISHEEALLLPMERTDVRLSTAFLRRPWEME